MRVCEDKRVAVLSEYDGLVKHFKPNKTGRVHINVALRKVCVPIFTVEKQQVLRILSVCF